MKTPITQVRKKEKQQRPWQPSLSLLSVTLRSVYKVTRCAQTPDPPTLQLHPTLLMKGFRLNMEAKTGQTQYRMHTRK